MRLLDHRPRHAWTADQIARAAAIYADAMARHGIKARAFAEIAGALGLDVLTVTNRGMNHGPRFERGNNSVPIRAAAAQQASAARRAGYGALADRAAREAAMNRRTLTQVVFGDPPPGYSALDRRGR